MCMAWLCDQLAIIKIVAWFVDLYAKTQPALGFSFSLLILLVFNRREAAPMASMSWRHQFKSLPHELLLLLRLRLLKSLHLQIQLTSLRFLGGGFLVTAAYRLNYWRSIFKLFCSRVSLLSFARNSECTI